MVQADFEQRRFQQLRHFPVGMSEGHPGEHGQVAAVVPRDEKIAGGLDELGCTGVADTPESGCVPHSVPCLSGVHGPYGGPSRLILFTMAGYRIAATSRTRQSGRMIELRVLTPDDWKLWRELRLAALGEAAYAFGSQLADWQGDGDREDRWRARLSIPGAHDIVAMIDGQPVGMASGVPGAQDRTVELISMYVVPRGRGQGVGDRLVQAIAGWAKRTGTRTLRLAVVDGNEHAKALYRRCGFRDTGEVGDLMPDAGVRREHIMTWELAGEGTRNG